MQKAAFYDIDAIERWCRSQSSDVDCRGVLGVWNLVADIPEQEDFYVAVDERADALYDKLFAGSNLPSMVIDQPYSPVWTTTRSLP